MVQQPRNRELRNSRAVAFRDLIQRFAPLGECRTPRLGRGKTHKRVVGFPATCDKAEQVRENSWKALDFGYFSLQNRASLFEAEKDS